MCKSSDVLCVARVRVIQQAFIDMENMFDLMKEEQEVSDLFVQRLF